MRLRRVDVPTCLSPKFWVLGDVHLGKVFRTGVSPDMRGWREEQVFIAFSQHLMAAVETNRHFVQVGDLFDTFRVPNEIVLRAAQAVRRCAEMRPGKMFIFLAGNHDEARDTDKVSSFRIFGEMLCDLDNVEIIRGDADTLMFENCLFVGFNAFRSPAEQLAKYDGPFDAVFGHWDVVDVGAENPQLMPFNRLQEITKLVVTGHDHLPRHIEYGQGEVRVLVTGSMQPYSHAEDPDEEIYVTRTAEQVMTDPTLYDGKFLRVLLAPDGDTFDRTKVKAISVTFKHVDSEGTDVQHEIDLDEIFDMTAEVKAAFKDVPADVSAKIQSLLEDARNV